MKSCNVVRYKVKPEHKDEYIQAMSKMELMESNLSMVLAAPASSGTIIID